MTLIIIIVDFELVESWSSNSTSTRIFSLSPIIVIRSRGVGLVDYALQLLLNLEILNTRLLFVVTENAINVDIALCGGTKEVTPHFQSSNVLIVFAGHEISIKTLCIWFLGTLYSSARWEF